MQQLIFFEPETEMVYSRKKLDELAAVVAAKQSKKK